MKLRRLVASIMGFGFLGASLVMAPAEAQWTSQPTMIGDNQVSVIRGADSWISVAWTAPTDMESFRMEVIEWQAGTELSYADGANAAYLFQDRTLSAGEIDVASFQLTTSAQTPNTFYIQVIASWEFEGQTYRFYPGGLNVRLVDYNGSADYELLTSSATVADIGDGRNNWVELDFLGLAPATRDLKVTVSGGVDVYYPQETYTSLHHDSLLNGSEEDVARIWIDPDLVTAGIAQLTLTVTYEVNGQSRTATHPFTLTIV